MESHQMTKAQLSAAQQAMLDEAAKHPEQLCAKPKSAGATALAAIAKKLTNIGLIEMVELPGDADPAMIWTVEDGVSIGFRLPPADGADDADPLTAAALLERNRQRAATQAATAALDGAAAEEAAAEAAAKEAAADAAPAEAPKREWVIPVAEGPKPRTKAEREAAKKAKAEAAKAARLERLRQREAEQAEEAAKPAKPARAPRAPKAEGEADDAAPADAGAPRMHGKTREAMEAAQRGVLPQPPDFSAATHTRFRPKLEQVVKLVEAGDLDGLRAFHINPISTSPKAIKRYRDFAIMALEAQAAAQGGEEPTAQAA
jgi:hypothetical protein